MQFKDGKFPATTYADKRAMVRWRQAWRAYIKREATMDKTVRSIGHFDFQVLNTEGLPLEKILQVTTITGLILNCHVKCEPEQIRRLAEIARDNPDYPVDLTAWDKYGPYRTMIWSARIYWRDS